MDAYDYIICAGNAVENAEKLELSDPAQSEAASLLAIANATTSLAMTARKTMGLLDRIALALERKCF